MVSDAKMSKKVCHENWQMVIGDLLGNQGQEVTNSKLIDHLF